MKRISISFTKLTDVNFQKKAEFIYTSLNDNGAFTNLSPALTVVKTGIDNYTTDLGAAATNERNAVAKKNQSRKELEIILAQLGLSVMTEANGNVTMLVSSGFTLVKNREPRYITNPGNVTLSNGMSSGEMVSSIKAITGSKSYVHQIATEMPVSDSVWTSNTSSTCKFLFTNLIPGKQYWVRVAVIGSRNQTAYSSVASIFVQ